MKITKPFAFAHGGCRVVNYSPEDNEIPADAAEWAVENGYATKAIEAAPENKDAASKRKTKSKG